MASELKKLVRWHVFLILGFLILFCGEVYATIDLTTKSTSCFDSDAFSNSQNDYESSLFISGFASQSGMVFEDYCVSEFTLNERICVGDAAINTSRTCEFGCSAGSCVYEDGSTNAPLCLDPDGENFNLKSITTYNTSLGLVNYTDYCTSPTTASDFVCHGAGEISVQFSICGLGCNSGACVGNSAGIDLKNLKEDQVIICSDSDQGNAYVRGTAMTFINQVIIINTTDSCLNSNTLFEQTCSNGAILTSNLLCEKGCVDGACVGCVDSDQPVGEGQNGPEYVESFFVLGSVWAPNGNFLDSCDSSNSVNEKMCNNGNFMMVSTSCEFGCVGGVCLREAVQPPAQPPSPGPAPSSGGNNGGVNSGGISKPVVVPSSLPSLNKTINLSIRNDTPILTNVSAALNSSSEENVSTPSSSSWFTLTGNVIGSLSQKGILIPLILVMILVIVLVVRSQVHKMFTQSFAARKK
ncbi:MAG: hypothetical protein AABY00_03185 [Nanoarchaeota archaeon]